ncbi:MAG: Na+/H+ antiporter subunit E [Actinomycetota bacterium]
MSIRRVLTVVALVAAWCALWGEVTVANLLSGVLVAGVVVASGAGTSARGGVRLRPLVRLAGLVAVDLVESTVSVSREILTRTDRTEEAIIAVRVPAETRSHLLLLVVAITVTPGTAVVDADADTGTLYLHLLHVDRRRQLERHVAELARLACAAFPPSTARSGPRLDAISSDATTGGSDADPEGVHP